LSWAARRSRKELSKDGSRSIARTGKYKEKYKMEKNREVQNILESSLKNKDRPVLLNIRSY
jgi:hypothetical protein